MMLSTLSSEVTPRLTRVQLDGPLTHRSVRHQCSGSEHPVGTHIGHGKNRRSQVPERAASSRRFEKQHEEEGNDKCRLQTK
jgi:hypothetical protein